MTVPKRVLSPLNWLALFALCGAGAARAERLPMQSDVDRCALRAVDLGNFSLAGTVRLELLVRKSGQVYAAFAHSGKGSIDAKFDYCLASEALLWQYPGTPVDTTAPFPISVAPGGDALADTGSRATVGQQTTSAPPRVFLPAAHPEIPVAELEVARAQASLNVLSDATAAEQGLAALAVHNYAAATERLRAALAKDPSDALALRGLAQALVESHGDLEAAREAALKLAAVQPGSVVGPEAILRVCAARGDDACVFEAWKAARAAQDVAPRSRILQSELQPLVEKSAARLRASAGDKHAGDGDDAHGAEAAPVDPCATAIDAQAQALCVVKRCFDEGSLAYARELSKGGAEFEAGEWRSAASGKDRLIVTRPISSKTDAGAASVHHDAMFLVKLGEQFSIQPSSADARKIVLEHNACAAKSGPTSAPAPPANSPATK